MAGEVDGGDEGRRSEFGGLDAVLARDRPPDEPLPGRPALDVPTPGRTMPDELVPDGPVPRGAGVFRVGRGVRKPDGGEPAPPVGRVFVRFGRSWRSGRVRWCHA